MGRGMADMAGFMRDIQKQSRDMKRKMDEVEESLRQRIVEGSAGGGMVKVMVNGAEEIVAVKISREVVNPDETEMLEDLVLAACAQGLKLAAELHEREMAKLTSGLKMPGIF